MALSISPAAITFKSFRTGHLYRSLVSVKNSSPRPVAISFSPPSSTSFKLICDSKGWLEPGSATFHVEFVPQEARYYYDCVRINSDQQQISLPLHGFPRPPDILEAPPPKIVSVGTTPITESITKTLALRCKVETDSTYSLDISYMQPSQTFTVTVAPPNIKKWGYYNSFYDI